MNARVYLDTDVILDLLLRREPFFGAATDLFLAIQAGRIEACVSPLIFSNLFYIVRQKLPPSAALNALRKLRLLVRALPVDERILDLALASSFTDFEDALRYYTAQVHGLDAVVTRNKRDFRKAREARMHILDARECVELFGVTGAP